MEKNPITIQAVIIAPIQKVWECWNKPEHITKWAFADATWEAPYSENDLRVGGTFKTTMAAKDKSASFDFGGVYSNVIENEVIEYDLADGRHVKTVFENDGNSVKVTQTFDPETQNDPEFQKKGWQAILDNFKKYTESN